jgi:hypothetical protein
MYVLRRCRTSRSEGCIPLRPKVYETSEFVCKSSSDGAPDAHEPNRQVVPRGQGAASRGGSLAKLDHRGRVSSPNRRLSRGRGMTTVFAATAAVLLLLRRPPQQRRRAGRGADRARGPECRGTRRRDVRFGVPVGPFVSPANVHTQSTLCGFLPLGLTPVRLSEPVTCGPRRATTGRQRHQPVRWPAQAASRAATFGAGAEA